VVSAGVSTASGRTADKDGVGAGDYFIALLKLTKLAA